MYRLGMRLFLILGTLGILLCLAWLDCDAQKPMIDGPATDWLLVRLDSVGNMCWWRQYQHDWYDDCSAAVATHTGGFALAGVTGGNGSGGGCCRLMVTDSTGNVLWDRQYVCDSRQLDSECHALIQLNDGRFILAGGSEYGLPRSWILCVSETGEELWTNTFRADTTSNPPRYETCLAVEQTPDGGFVMAGYANFPQKRNEGYLLKTDNFGHKEWFRTYGGEFNDAFVSVTLSADSQIIVAGTRGSDIYGTPPIGWVVITDTEGNLVQEFMLLSDRSFQPAEICALPGGEMVTTGRSTEMVKSRSPKYTIILMKLDRQGNTLWSREFAKDKARGLESVCATPDGGFLICGNELKQVVMLRKPVIGQAGLVAKTDGLGRPEWSLTMQHRLSASFTAVGRTADGFFLAGTVERSLHPDSTLTIERQ
jgi:hypothetical protein